VKQSPADDTQPIELPRRRPSSILIADPAPVVDGGAHPTKRCAGDQVAVSATIFRDGGAPRDRWP
jgi:hypothetical protein